MGRDGSLSQTRLPFKGWGGLKFPLSFPSKNFLKHLRMTMIVMLRELYNLEDYHLKTESWDSEIGINLSKTVHNTASLHFGVVKPPGGENMRVEEPFMKIWGTNLNNNSIYPRHHPHGRNLRVSRHWHLPLVLFQFEWSYQLSRWWAASECYYPQWPGSKTWVRILVRCDHLKKEA